MKGGPVVACRVPHETAQVGAAVAQPRPPVFRDKVGFPVQYLFHEPGDLACLDKEMCRRMTAERHLDMFDPQRRQRGGDAPDLVDIFGFKGVIDELNLTAPA